MAGDTETNARLFYLSLLGAFIIGSFLFSYRQRLGQTLQQAAIWLVIFLLVIIAYGFRGELERQLYPARATLSATGDIILNRAADGHFYAIIKIDGTAVRFVVDTGATSVVLSRQDARSIGIDLSTLDYSGRASTANGVIRTANVTLQTLNFAGQTDVNIPAEVSGGDMEISLLGMSYLARFNRIEIVGERLLLAR